MQEETAFLHKKCLAQDKVVVSHLSSLDKCFALLRYNNW